MNENKYDPNSLSNRIKFFGAMGTIFTAAILIVLGLFTYFANLETQNKLNTQTEKITQIVEQNKELQSQTLELAQRAANYAYCNAVILSQYTQTLQPISIQDLNTCVTNTFPDGTGPTTIDDGSELPLSLKSINQNNQNDKTPNGLNTFNPQKTTTPSVSPTPTPSPSPSPTQKPITLETTPTTLLPGVNLGVPLPCINLILGIRVC